MSDTAVNDHTNALSLDGEAPRLGSSSAPIIPVAPPAASFANVDGGSTLSAVPPVLTDGSAALPSLPSPTLPAPTPAVPVEATVADAETPLTAGEQRHPMAHLMPEKMKPTEASMRAAEARAAKKAKAKKIKIGVAIGAIAVTAVVGPPLARWTMNAINEAGKTSTDEPAPEPAADPEPQATPEAGIEAIEDAKQVTGQGDAPAPTAP